MVNVTARLQDFAPGGVAAISDAAWQEIKDDLSKFKIPLYVKDLGKVVIRGSKRDEYVRLIVPLSLKKRKFTVARNKKQSSAIEELKEKIEILRQQCEESNQKVIKLQQEQNKRVLLERQRLLAALSGKSFMSNEKIDKKAKEQVSNKLKKESNMVENFKELHDALTSFEEEELKEKKNRSKLLKHGSFGSDKSPRSITEEIKATAQSLLRERQRFHFKMALIESMLARAKLMYEKAKLKRATIEQARREELERVLSASKRLSLTHPKEVEILQENYLNELREEMNVLEKNYNEEIEKINSSHNKSILKPTSPFTRKLATLKELSLTVKPLITDCKITATPMSAGPKSPVVQLNTDERVPTPDTNVVVVGKSPTYKHKILPRCQTLPHEQFKIAKDEKTSVLKRNFSVILKPVDHLKKKTILKRIESLKNWNR